MSGLAKHLLLENYTIMGSDLYLSDKTAELEKLGAKIHHGHKRENLGDADCLIYTSAVKSDNPELEEAKKRGIPVVKRSQLLGKIIAQYKNSIAVAGSHGKTTATAMISSILVQAGKDPTVFLGGDVEGYGNYRHGESDTVVLEACEYEKNILDIKPKIAVVLNIDDDHMDCYKNMKEMVCTFREFCKDSLTFVNADDKRANDIFNSTTITFGIDKLANYQAKYVKKNCSGYSFNVYSCSKNMGRINLKIMGKHNIYNALCAVAVCDTLGINFSVIRRALESFLGVKRRNEYLGKAFGLNVYADYAHHPREIEATLSAYSEDGNDYLTIFQPHTYSRTKILMDEFVQVLSKVNPLVIYKEYPAREKFDQSSSARALYDNIKNKDGKDVFYADSYKDIDRILKATSSDIKRIVFLGAGDIYEIAKRTVDTNGYKPN